MSGSAVRRRWFVAMLMASMTMSIGHLAVAETAPGDSEVEEPVASAVAWFPAGGPFATTAPQVDQRYDRLLQLDETGAPHWVSRRDDGIWESSLLSVRGYSSTPVFPTALNEAPNAPPIAEIFGVERDGEVWRWSWGSFPGLAPPQPLGGQFTSAAEAVRFRGVTHVFGVGLDGAVWYQSVGSGWVSLGGVIVSDLAVTTDGVNLYVFGIGQDGAMWSRQSIGLGWGPWQSLGGGFLSSPESAFDGDSVGNFPGFVPQPSGYVVAIGLDRAVWWTQVVWVSGPTGGPPTATWTGWHSAGGEAVTAPAVAADPDGGVNVFVVGNDLAMWQRHLGRAESAWTNLGGGFTSAPGANGNYVFGIGLDDGLYGAIH